MVFHHTDRFEKPFATFLDNTHGNVTEKEIKRSNIKTYIQINMDNVSKGIHIISKLVYLRRYYEISNKRGMPYHIISSLLHKRIHPTLTENDTERDMSDNEIADGTNEIKDYVSDFDYDELVTVVKNDSQLVDLYKNATNNYEKLHIYRLIFDDKVDEIESDIIQKFINQAFHTENDYIYQLDPSQYQTVPQYVIDECDRYISSIN